MQGIDLSFQTHVRVRDPLTLLLFLAKTLENVCEIYVKNPSWTNHDETKPSWRAQVKADYCVKALITEISEAQSCGNTPVFKINADAFYSTAHTCLEVD